VEYGFIAAIILDAMQQCNIIVHKVRINHWDYLILKKKRFINPFIFWGKQTQPPELTTIDLNSIIVKLAYRKDRDLFHFFQFPNTVEST
jgi:hypothetical protein